MIAAHIILALLWIGFCLFHSLFASQKFKMKAEGIMGFQYRYYRLYYTIFSFVSLFTVLWYLVTLRSVQFFKTNIFTNILGAITGVAGLTVMAICIKKYFAHLSGIKSLYLQEQYSNELMITGIHRYLRHPLYAGTFLFIWGLWILFPVLSLLITDVIITVYTIIGIKWEEQKLESEFGESYKQYKNKVPKLIPSFRDGKYIKIGH